MSKLVKRPWGTYTVLAKSKDFLLKKITVLPEGVLSYQSHSLFRDQLYLSHGQLTHSYDRDNVRWHICQILLHFWPQDENFIYKILYVL